jgi:spermidine/putrescine transport system substrate-binding protein
MTRRDFLRRAAATAVGVPSLAAILASCTKPGAGGIPSGSASGSSIADILAHPARPDHPVTLPTFEDPIAADTPIEQGATLQLYNWTDYLWPRIYKEFEDKYRQHDVTIEVTTFNDIAEGIQKISSGQVQADVFFPDPSELAKLSVSQLLKPLNHDLLPNLATNYWPEFQNPFYDQGWHYSVPYTIYTTGIAYRRDHIPDEDVSGRDNPYEILWDPKYRGKVTVYDDFRETIGMALLKNGITEVNTEDPDQIQAAKNDLLKMIDATDAGLTINGIYSKMAQDQYWVGSSWSGDVVAAAIYYLPKGTPASVLGYWYPPNGGGMIGNDLMVIPSSGKNPRLAHEFLNFMLDRTHSYANFVNFNGYQTPMPSINPAELVPKVIPPTLSEAVVQPSYFDKGHFLLELTPEAQSLWTAAWDEIKAGG